jgi:hypothetical protein
VGPLLAAWFAVEIGHVLRTGAWPDLAALVLTRWVSSKKGTGWG